jgi:hypothetical protein
MLENEGLSKDAASNSTETSGEFNSSVFFQQQLHSYPSNHLDLPELVKSVDSQIKSVNKQIQDFIAFQKVKEEMLYEALGQNPESAMSWDEISKTMCVYKKLQIHYGKQYKEKGGTDAILGEFADYLAKICNEPLSKIDPEKRKYERSDPKDVRAVKSALRTILDEAPNSKFGSCLHPNAIKIYGSGENFYARDLLAYYILAASDEQMVLPSEYSDKKRAQCIVEEKLNVIYNLSDIRREHNGKGDYREKHDSTDETSCFPGVIGRIGNMHVHNPVTQLDEIISPIETFERKMQAFIIRKFSNVSPNQQFEIINSIYYKTLNMEEDESNPSFKIFMNRLLNENSYKDFLQELELEFGEFDMNHMKASVLYYFKVIAESTFQISQSLMSRLESIANENLVNVIKENIEESLGNEVQVVNAVNKLTTTLTKLTQLRDDIYKIREKGNINFKKLILLEEKWERIKENFLILIEEEIVSSQLIQKIADKHLVEVLQTYEETYSKNRGKKVEILTDKMKSKIYFYPFWYLKLKLKFEDLELGCETEAIEVQIFLKKQKEQFLIEKLSSFLFEVSDGKAIFPKQIEEMTDKTSTLLDKAVEAKEPMLQTLQESRDQLDQVLENVSSSFDNHLQVKEGISLTKKEKKHLLKVLVNENETSDRLRLPQSLSNILHKVNIVTHQADALLGKPSKHRHKAQSPQGIKGRLVAFEQDRLTYRTDMLDKYEIQKAQHYIMAHSEIAVKLGLEGYLKPGILVKIGRVNCDPVTVSFVDPFRKSPVKQIVMWISQLKEYAQNDKHLRAQLAHEADILVRAFSELHAIQGTQGHALQNLFLGQLLHYKQENRTFYDQVLQRQTTLDLSRLLEVLHNYEEDHPYVALQEDIEMGLNRWQKDYIESQSNRPQTQWEHNKAKAFHCVLEDEVQKIYMQNSKIHFK